MLQVENKGGLLELCVDMTNIQIFSQCYKPTVDTEYLFLHNFINCLYTLYESHNTTT